MKKVMIGLAAVFALTVVFLGADTFACGGKSKSTVQTAGAACPTSGGCCSSSKTAGMNGGAGSCTQTSSSGMSDKCTGSSNSADWTSNVCGSKGYYAANVFAMCHGHEYAVYGEETFEVTEKTPFIQNGQARYYFPSEELKVKCAQDQQMHLAELEQETVSLATADGNVVSVNSNGEKVAQCPVTGKSFVVTADSPVKVLDGKRYYLNGGTELSTVSDRIHQ
jgi:hypothetical protein